MNKRGGFAKFFIYHIKTTIWVDLKKSIAWKTAGRMENFLEIDKQAYLFIRNLRVSSQCTYLATLIKRKTGGKRVKNRRKVRVSESD